MSPAMSSSAEVFVFVVVIFFVSSVAANILPPSIESYSAPDQAIALEGGARGVGFTRDVQKKIRYLDQKLREDIERQIEDLIYLERQLANNIGTIQRKKESLEAKKRQPFQCLVNVVSCWKK